MREELDFKSLRFFSALYRLGNVSPAAEALDISQPTGSLLLKKLREHFDDPLFVRVGQRMAPTPRADAIAPTIFTLLQLADSNLAAKPEFIPQESNRNFTIGMTDISQMTLLPLLQSQLQRLDASGITFTVLKLTIRRLARWNQGNVIWRSAILPNCRRASISSICSISRMFVWQRTITRAFVIGSAPKTGVRKSTLRFASTAPPTATLINCWRNTVCHGVSH